MSATKAALAVLVDGAPLPPEEARAIWERFSDWMEEHRGDLAGFAAQEGFASIHPSVEAGRPVLLASRSAPQRPYAPVGGGSSARHEPTATHRPDYGKSKKRSGKPRP